MANIVGTTGNDTLDGTDGPDTIDGIMGTDYLYGRAGNDRFVFSGVKYSSPTPPTGLIDGGEGFDEIDLSNVSPVSISNYSSSQTISVGNQGFSIQNIERIILGDNSVYLSIYKNDIEYITGSGNDQIYTYGSFKINSGSGNDRIYLSSSYSSSGSSFVDSGTGIDTLDIGTSYSSYTLDLESGKFAYDISVSGFENVDVSGSGIYLMTPPSYPYNPAIQPVLSGTIIRANSSDNILTLKSTSTGGGLLDGRAGNDVLNGSNYADRLYGGDGNDRIFGRGGVDQIFGEAGDDYIEAMADGDAIDGGSGFDVVSYSGLTHRYVINTASMGAQVRQGTYTDAITGVENINFRDATLTFDVDSKAAFVMRLYDSTLDRGPDAQGLDYWLDQMDAGVSKSAVANAFLQSPEFARAAGTLSTGDFVDFLYVEALGRPSDTAGKAFWVGQIDGGLSRGDALLNFSESAEHKAQTADMLAKGLWVTDNKYQAITALYDTFSNRLPDEDGLGYWVGQLQSGQSLSTIASGFAGSSEFSNATAGFSNGQLVDFMYENTLDRAADAGGRENWVGQLDRGLSKGDLMLGFSESAEHYHLLEAHLFAGVDYFMAA